MSKPLSKLRVKRLARAETPENVGPGSLMYSLAGHQPGASEFSMIFLCPPGSMPDLYDSADPLVRHTEVVGHITSDCVAIYSIPGLCAALKKLEATCRSGLQDWLDSLGLDDVVFPCNGGVGKADSDVKDEWEGPEEKKGTPEPKKAMITVEAPGKHERSSAELSFL